MPGFYSKRAKNSGKCIPPVCSRWQDKSIGVSYVAIGSVSQEEFDQQVKKDYLLLVYIDIDRLYKGEPERAKMAAEGRLFCEYLYTNNLYTNKRESFLTC